MMYKTQMDAAKHGIITPQIATVAEKENRTPEWVRERVAAGTIAIPANVHHTSLSAEGIGDGLRTKINVNLGISGDAKDYELEMNKVKMSVEMGAESIMDLSNYGKTHDFRKKLIDYSPAMIGTVPMYDAIGYLDKDLLDIKINKDKSYMISWYSWCTSIADYIEANSPYRLEDTAIDSPNSIRCVSTTNPTVWFELK